MPTFITHAMVPPVSGAAFGRQSMPGRLHAACAVAAMLPDADVLAFAFGIADADAFGHRGASHAVMFTLAFGAVAALLVRRLHARPWQAFAWRAACTASHTLLDALTDRGPGVALWWPASDVRVFAPWRPIEATPIGAGFLSLRGLAVLASERVWVWLSTLVVGIVVYARRARALR